MTRRRKLLLTCVGVGLVVAVGLVAYRGGLGRNAGAADRAPGNADSSRAAVRTIHPKKDPNFRIANEQVAWVEPFYQAGLRARASGVIRTVPKEIGESVRAGEVLVQIDAPDLFADVDQREAVIKQREEELRVSKAMLGFADAAVKAAKAAVNQRKAEVKAAAATRDFKFSYFNRMQGMLNSKTVPEGPVFESKKDYLAAEAAVEAAEVAVTRADADQAEKEA